MQGSIFVQFFLVTYEKTCVTLTVQVNIHDTTLVEKSGQAVSAFFKRGYTLWRVSQEETHQNIRN